MRFRPGNKYNRKKVDRDGRTFDSKLEAAVYDELRLLEKAGNISDLKCQLEVRLTDANILYKPDFSFVEDDELIYAEAKGFETQRWPTIKKLWKFYGPGELRIYKGSYRNPVLHEVIKTKKGNNA